MTELDTYGRMAEKHWRAYLPGTVAALEAKGELRGALIEAQENNKHVFAEAEERLKKEDPLHPHPTMLERQDYFRLIQERAWEEVKERYILLPPE